MAVTTISRDGIAVITFDNPPVNGMGLAVRRGMADALAHLAEKPATPALHRENLFR